MWISPFLPCSWFCQDFFENGHFSGIHPENDLTICPRRAYRQGGEVVTPPFFGRKEIILHRKSGHSPLFLHPYITISFRNSLAACPHWRTCPIPGSLPMCYPGSFPASHGDWGTIPDGTSAACGTVHSLPVWPLSRQYLHLMKLEQDACVWHHQSLLILLKVNGYLSARVPARRASFPKGAAESGGVLFHRRGLLDE